MLIQDALTKVDYLPIGKNGSGAPYPVTLLWYPNQEKDREHSVTTEELLDSDFEPDKSSGD